MHSRSVLVLGLLAAVALVAGCGSGGKKDHSLRTRSAASTTSSALTAPTTSAAPAASSSGIAPGTSATAVAPPFVVEVVAPVASQTEQAFPSRVVGLALRLASGAASVDVSRLEVTSTGSMDESRLGQACLFEDGNGNGEVDSNDVLLASAPAAAANDAPYVFALPTPFTVTPGTPRMVLVTVDTAVVGSSGTVAYVGSTLDLAITGALSVRADAAGTPVTASGAFPLARQVVLEVNDTVLISEVATGFGSNGQSSEFVELFNATGRSVDLSTYYLTDFTDRQTTGRYYWKLPTGQDFFVVDGDFYVKFPAGTTLRPGQVVVLALDAGGFQTTYGFAPDFTMRNISGARTTAVQLLSWDGVVGGVNFVPTPIAAGVSLKGPGPAPFDPIGEGESVFLLRWDGTSDLIQDVDIVNYGSATPTNVSVNKSPGQRAPYAPDVRVDSAFDADTTASTFQPELDELHQEDRRAPLGPSTERVDFTEGHERKTGGNGLTGNDETSEDLGVYLPSGTLATGTFRASTVPTPRRLP